MWIGNLMLVVLNLPLVGLWVRLLWVPYRWLFPSIVMFCCIGNYSVTNNSVDVYLCAALGALGYVLAKLECEPAPLLLGYVLGPLFEEHLRRAMLLARGDPLEVLRAPDQPRVRARHRAGARGDGLASAAAGRRLFGRNL